MIGILSQVTEIHNSESIHHISRVQRITSILLERLCQKTDIYGLNGIDRYLITTASALHDIGKVAIDDHILSAHDLTPEQTAILHTHPILCADAGKSVPVSGRAAGEICDPNLPLAP